MASLILNWDTSKLLFEAVGNFEATINEKDVAKALMVVAGAASVSKLPALLTGMGVGSVMMYTVLRYIRKTWPSIDASLGKDNNVQLSRGSVESEFFEELTKEGGELEKQLMITKPAEILRDDLKGIEFDEDTNTKIVKLTEQLKDIRLTAVERLTSKQGPVGEILKGKGDFKNQGTTTMVFSGIGRMCEAGSETKEVNRDTFKVIGADPGFLKHAYDSFSENKVKVVVRFADRETRKFEKRYGMDEIVHDIITDISEERKMKITKICAMKNKEEIDDQLTVKGLQEKNLLKSLMAYYD